MHKIKHVILLVGLLVSSLANADTTARQQLELFLDNTQSFSASFKQKLESEFGELLQQSAGKLSMQRPGKFRWDYSEPYPQNIISNGEKIWMYDSELEQVNVRPYEQVQSSPVNLLDNREKLDLAFSIVEMPSQEQQNWVKLIPKQPDSDFKVMLVGLQNGKIKTMRFLDNFNQQTEISFDKLIINPVFKEDTFIFKVPQGVDVMGDY